MKHIRTFESYKSFRNNQNSNVEPVNEEIFGAIGKFFSNLFKKMKEKINKTKGGSEVEAIYAKYIKQINDQLSKQAGVDINIQAGEKLDAKKAEAAKAATAKKESLLINEADEADAKMAVENLKKKKGMMDQIVAKLKQMAIKEMDAVLKKYGGSAANPQLEIIINAKKDQFELDYLNAQISYLEQSGDTTQVPAIVKQRDQISKRIEKEYAEFDKVKPVEYKEDDSVIYLKKDKEKSDYDPKKKPEDQKDVVGVGTIVSKDGDKIKIKDEEGKEQELSSDKLVGKTGGKSVDFKVGDTVIFKRDGFNDNDGKKRWSELKDEDKENTDSDGIKKMIEDELINVKKVEKIEGDFFVFKGKDDKEFKKNKSEVLGVTKAKEEGKEEKPEGEEKKEGQAEGEENK